jgi:hypothetical protein
MAMTRDPQRLALRLIQVFVGAILLLSLLLAIVVPYHATDALVYGQFSKVLGLQGGFLHDTVSFGDYARPLFYVPQGWLWWVFGAHEWIGRLLSLGFFVLLLWSVWRLAADRSLPAVAPWLALLALLACPDVVIQAFAGQTDVPVAALLGAAAVLLWRRPAGPGTGVLITLLALAAVLAKSTALPALVGLGAAHLIGARAQLRTRVVAGVLPLAAGTVLGLVYGLVMARHFGVSLDVFLGGSYGQPAPAATAAAPGSWLPGGSAALAPLASITERVHIALDAFFGSDTRPGALVHAAWLGPYLRLLLIDAVLYAAARAVGIAHRAATLGALALAVVIFVVGPAALPGPGSVTGGGAVALAGSVALAAVLAASAWVPEQWVLSRTLAARLLVWMIPSVAAWVLFGIVDDTRTVSPAWPAVFPLLAATTAMGVAALAARRAWLGALAAVVLLVLALANFRNFDGLGVQPDGSYDSLSALRHLGPGTWTDPHAARRAADPQLGGLVDGLRAATGSPQAARLRTNDGRLIFFSPEHFTVAPTLPGSCADLADIDAVALLIKYAPPADLQRLTELPCVRPVAGAAGSYAVYGVGDR